jgi:hypothetical protein
MIITLESGKELDIEITEPDFNDMWFKARTTQALRRYEHDPGYRKDRREQLHNVLAGLFRHAYNKGRHDEKRDAAASAKKGW